MLMVSPPPYSIAKTNEKSIFGLDIFETFFSLLKVEESSSILSRVVLSISDYLLKVVVDCHQSWLPTMPSMLVCKCSFSYQEVVFVSPSLELVWPVTCVD